MKSIKVSPKNLQAGTMMIREGVRLPDPLGMETVAYSRGWRSVTALDSFSLGRKLDAAGVHLFFVAGQVTSVAFGFGGDSSMRKAVLRIAAKVRALNLNCLELTEIHRKHFLSVPYISISAHTFHIQQGLQLQNSEERRRFTLQ